MLLLILVSLALVLVLYLIQSSKKKLQHWEKLGIKYVKPVPIFGNFLPTVLKTKSSSQLIQDIYNTYPDERFVGIYQFNTPTLVIRDPELIKTVTIKNFENFVDHHGFTTEDIDPLWTKNLFSSRGERWRDLRQTLSPVFTSSKMRTIFVLIDECVNQLVDYYQQQDQELINVELKDVFTRFTNDVIATTAFGIKCDSLKDRNNEFLLAGRELADFGGLKRFVFFMFDSYPRIAKFLNLKIVSPRIANFFTKIIKDTISLREAQNIIRPDLINSLMLARKGKLRYEDQMNLPDTGFATVTESDLTKPTDNVNFLTIDDITAQAVVFFLGGFDTSASLMCFTGYELAVNPEVQKKLKEEVLKTFHECNGKITYEKLLNMKYLDMVICESLRKWTQAVFLDRKCTKEFEIQPEKSSETPVKIREGDILLIPVCAIHHDPKYYPDPEVFDPERFSDENKDKIKAGTYLPFGIGPRNCIGSRFALLETKLLCYYLLLNFEIVVTEKTDIPLKLRKDTMMVLPENGFHVGLKKSKV